MSTKTQETQERKVNVSYELKRLYTIKTKLFNEKIITKEENDTLKKVHQQAILRWIGMDIEQINNINVQE